MEQDKGGKRTMRGPERAVVRDRAAKSREEAKQVRSLEAERKWRDKAALMTRQAGDCLSELEEVDDYRHRHSGDTPRAIADGYLPFFASRLAWRLTATFDAEGGDDVGAFQLERRAAIVEYLTMRFPNATPEAVDRAARKPSRLSNAEVSIGMKITRSEWDALDLRSLLWAGATESDRHELKLGRQRAKGAAARRAAGKPTAAERRTGTIAELARLVGVSRRSIEKWRALGTLTAKIAEFALVVPYGEELRTLTAKVENSYRLKAGRAPSATPTPSESMLFGDTVTVAGPGLVPDPASHPIVDCQEEKSMSKTEPSLIEAGQKKFTDLSPAAFAQTLGAALAPVIADVADQAVARALAERDRQAAVVAAALADERAERDRVLAHEAGQAYYATAEAVRNKFGIDTALRLLDAIGPVGWLGPNDGRRFADPATIVGELETGLSPEFVALRITTRQLGKARRLRMVRDDPK